MEAVLDALAFKVADPAHRESGGHGGAPRLAIGEKKFIAERKRHGVDTRPFGFRQILARQDAVIQHCEPAVPESGGDHHLLRAKVVAGSGRGEVVAEKIQVVRTHGGRQVRGQAGHFSRKGGDRKPTAKQSCRGQRRR